MGAATLQLAVGLGQESILGTKHVEAVIVAGSLQQACCIANGVQHLPLGIGQLVYGLAVQDLFKFKTSHNRLLTSV